VGDAAFQEKCLNRMAGFRDSGATVLMVSHSIDRIRTTCERALWLDHGKIQAIDSAEKVSNAYQSFLSI
jgi:lipopolysaccharide transport system ATP-binding protein